MARNGEMVDGHSTLALLRCERYFRDIQQARECIVMLLNLIENLEKRVAEFQTETSDEVA